MVNHSRPVYILLTFLLFITIITIGCSRKKASSPVWDINLFRIGSQSSPRAVDLNGDGVLDIVMGAGLNEYQKSKQGIIALDGKTGDLLWQQESPDQVYGSATFYDINGDGVKDVFIGGRSPHFKALNGKTGEILWEYQYDHFKNDSILKHARFNFNNSVLVPDQNNDGLQDLLTVNGGNSKADPYSDVNRFPGVLMLLDSKTGNIIAADTMPDGGESYMSPLCFAQPGEKEFIIVFGTGGETISGHLYAAKLSDLLETKLSKAKIIASEENHGFIAPPSLADISGDGYLDIIAITHGSTALAIDGKSHQQLWSRKIENTESSNSLAVGYFTSDDVPDFFTFVSKGQWPNSTGTLQVMLDGKSGEIAYLDSMGCTGFSSPVVYDLDDDGIDEAIISINEYDCSLGFTGKSPAEIENKLISIHFNKRSFKVIDQTVGFKNVFSTPWIGDIDADGYLDIVHCQYYHYGNLLSFLGMRVKRIDTDIKIKKNIVWGAYMGSNGNGMFISP
jgi:outer membrane protein assembly factor BamB